MSLLVPIVEGQSEERAIGVLLRRLLTDIGATHVDVARPFRVKRNRVVREGELERSIAQAIRSRPGATNVLVLLDADRDCAAELAPKLVVRARAATDIPVHVVFPNGEIEAWVLAATESVRGVRGIRQDAEPPPSPESVRDAKGALTARMEGSRGYVATDDLSAFFAALDVTLATERSPSAAKLLRDLRSLCETA